MNKIPEELRRKVRERAHHRCEYCLSSQQYILGQLQLDHVIPLSKGGQDNEGNLCLACELCNQHKWAKTHGFDPHTKQQVPLFNPRQQNWHDHFCWNAEGTHIIGLTPCGRVTVSTLQLNNDLAVIVRRNWIRAGWHPPCITT